MGLLHKLKLLLNMAVAISFLSGCGSKFSAEKTTALQSSQSVTISGTGNNSNTPTNLTNPIANVDEAGLVADLTDPSGSMSKLTTDLNLPYGILSKPLERALNEALNQYVRTQDCDKVGTSEDTRAPLKQYRCGEIPFGDIMDSGKKFLYQVGIPSTWGSQDGTYYWMGAGSFQIYLSRTQRPGSVSIEILDAKTGTQTVTTQESLGKDLFLKLNPHNGILNAGVCFTVPGTTVFANKLWLPGNLNRSFLWGIIGFNTDLSINVDVGQATFDSLKSCVAVAATYNKSTGLPQIQITGIERPSFQNLNLSGFQVHTDTNITGFAGVVVSILDAFGAGIQKMIADSVNQAVASQFDQQKQITVAQVTSGEWMLEMLHMDYLKPLLVDNINTSLNTQNTQGQEFEIEVSKWFSAGCLALVNSYGSLQQTVPQDKLYSLCKSIPHIQLNAFLDDPSMREKGCYDRFFSLQTLFTSPSVWWNTQCTVKNQIVVTAPTSMMPVFQCLADTVNSNFTSIETCRPFLDQIVAKIKSGNYDSYLQNIAAFDPYMADANVAFSAIQDIAKQFFGYNFNFVYDPSWMSTIAQALGITPTMNLDQITTAGTKTFSVINIDVTNAQNLLNAMIARKNAGTAPDVILLQGVNSDTARKFIKDINYPFVALGPMKSTYSNDAGIAILSKHKILQTSNFSFGQACLGSACLNNQGLIHARIQIDGVPHPVEFINTQFQSKKAAIDANLANLLDYTQNKQLLDTVGYLVANALTDLPMVVGGDFESNVASRIYQQLLYVLKARNGGKECADIASCVITTGSQRYQLWSTSFDHQFIRNSSKIAMKVIQGARAFQVSEAADQISNGGSLEMIYQLSWKP